MPVAVALPASHLSFSSFYKTLAGFLLIVAGDVCVWSVVGSMDRFLCLLSFLLLATVSHAALSPQLVYWHSVLPNTPMPSAISDFIDPDVLAEDKSGVNVYVKGKSDGTTVNVGHGGVHVGTGKPGGGGTNVNVGHGGVHVNTGHKGKPRVVVTVPSSKDFIYNYAATETQIHDDPNVALFFLEEELRSGAKMNLHFTKTTSGGASFLTQKEADAIPFSSTKLPEILDHFSVKPGSAEAEALKTTLQECEEPAVRGERKYCATSLESMVEFSMTSLGTRDVTAVSTTVAKAVTPRQQYTVTGVKALVGDRLVACHPEAYAYAVFYCHATATSKAYTVGLLGADGVGAEAVAVCHTDTRAWNPNHVAFKVLKVKPGSVPVCHFLPEDHVVWSRSG